MHLGMNELRCVEINSSLTNHTHLLVSVSDDMMRRTHEVLCVLGRPWSVHLGTVQHLGNVVQLIS